MATVPTAWLHAVAPNGANLEIDVNRVIMSFTRFLSFSIVLLLQSTTVLAQSAMSEEAVNERIKLQTEEALERLELVESQYGPARVILEESFHRRLEVLQKYGVDPQDLEDGKRPGMRTMRRMSADMDDVRDDTEKRLDTVLDDRQMRIWREMEEERQDEMRARMRGRG